MQPIDFSSSKQPLYSTSTLAQPIHSLQTQSSHIQTSSPSQQPQPPTVQKQSYFTSILSSLPSLSSITGQDDSRNKPSPQSNNNINNNLVNYGNDIDGQKELEQQKSRSQQINLDTVHLNTSNQIGFSSPPPPLQYQQTFQHPTFKPPPVQPSQSSALPPSGGT